jgi:hypothetical protein
MSGVERDKDRVRSTGEVFTPTSLVMEYVNWLDKTYPDAFADINNTFGDNSCGDAQFLGEILIKKLEKVAVNDYVTDEQFKDALSSIHGIDFQISNVDRARLRLLCGRTESKFVNIVEQNIIYGDGLNKKNYKFKPMTNGRRNEEVTARKRNLKEKLARQKAEEELRKLKEREKTLKRLFKGL